MTAKRKITDRNGVQVFPITHTKAVYDDNGNSVEQRLEEQMDVINQKQLEVGAVPSDLAPTAGSTNWVTSGGVYSSLQNICGSIPYSGLDYNGYGKIILSKNIKTEEIITNIIRTPYTLTSGDGYLIDLETYTIGYTSSSEVWKTRTTSTVIDVEAGTILEFNASSMMPAFDSVLYPHWRMWVLADASSGEIIKDDNDEYIMAPAAVDYEDSPRLVTIPKSGRLYINCWTGQTSRGSHTVNNIVYTTSQRELNALENSMFVSPNTIYVVKYDFDINSREIMLPENSILFFDGGNIKNTSTNNGAIVGNHSTICAINDNIFSDKVVIKGTWTNDEFYPEWFGAKGDGVTDDTSAIQAVLNVVSSITMPLQVTVKLNGSYVFSDTLVLYPNTTLRGNSVGAHNQNNKGINTLIAKFSTNLACAIISSNMKGSSYKQGAARTQIDGGSIKYCNSIRIENLRLIGEKVRIEDGGIITERPIFCGIKIIASQNSCIRDVTIQGFWYGVARFATWYASDSDLYISSYHVGYLAGHDMNDFSIHNGYINASAVSLGLAPSADETFNSDPIKAYSAGVLGIYATGELENVISENADYGRYLNAHTSIVEICPWMEQIKISAFGVYAGSQLVIIKGVYVGIAKFVSSYDSTKVSVIGNIPNANMNIGKYDVFSYNTVERNLTQKIEGLPSGVGRYNVTTHQASWWNSSKQIFADAYGFGLQDKWMGTYEERPKAPLMRPGSVYMKTESSGISRPIFQVSEGTYAFVYLTPPTLDNTVDGEITITIKDTVFTYNYISSNFSDVTSLINDMVTKAINTGLRAENYRGSFKLYCSQIGAVASEERSYNDGGTGLTGFKPNNTGSAGSFPVFVDALGSNAENDRKVSSLPVTAEDGDILFYTVIGKPVYYNNGHWFDFSDHEVMDNT